jgi:hypothetical protein
MVGIDDLVILGIAAGFSALAASVGELLKKYLSKSLSKDLEVQIKTSSGETVKISVATTGDKAGDVEAVARAVHEAQEAVSGSHSPPPTESANQPLI